MMRVPSTAVRACAHKGAVRGVAARAMSTSKFLRDVSDVPTMYYQSSLPRLPIPKLEDTCAKYLRSASAIMSPEAMEATKAKVAAFQAGPGKRLQLELVKHDDAHPETSYISDPWFDMYLENRDAFPLNLSPQLTWKDDEDASKMEQATRCANILGAAARFCNSLRANVLVPDVFHTKKEVFDNPLVQMGLHLLVPRRFAFYGAAAAGSYPLDMSQYGALFSSTRIPLKGKDRIVTQRVDQTFVIVQRGARFYKVHIMDPKTGPLPEEKIEAQLRAVLADKPGNEYPVGVLSAIDRDWAAELRPELVAMNKEAMHDIDSALFCVTLDDEAPTDDSALSRLMLHGNGRNRWFEKSFHIVVAANGKAGVNWEHSWGDGVAMLRFFEEVYKEISAEPARPKAEAAAPAKAFDFCLSPNLQANIVKAEKVTDEFFASAELEILQTDALAKGDLKKEKLSPDGTMQMVLQLAHHRMHGYTAATYESASTAAFKHGRTETIRSATLEANDFVAAFQNPDATREEKVAALRTAVDQHSAITKDAVMGKGFDRHLFGLRYMGQKKGLPVGDIYDDETYQTMMDIRLSTSTLSSAALGGGGFGPISPRAYSCGYGIVDEGCRFHIMTNGLGTKEFTEHLGTAAADIKAAITGSD